MTGQLKVLVAPDTWMPVGGQGPPGTSMHVGPSAPDDPDVDLWWDTDEEIGEVEPEPWTSPVASGITLGNGSITATYVKNGPTVKAWFRFTFGSSGSAVGNVLLNLPVTANTNSTAAGIGFAIDAAVAGYPLVVALNSATGATVYVIGTAGSYAVRSGLSTNVPFTWASTDEIHLSLDYQAA